MRPKKFRVWDAKLKKMFYYDGIFNRNQHYTEKSSFPQYESSPEYNQIEVMDDTNLTDKNGKSIYEGDLVSRCCHLRIGNEVVAEYPNEIAIVEYVEGSFRLNKPNSDVKNYYGVLNYQWNNEATALEVVGNIFENPELAEVTK